MFLVIAFFVSYPSTTYAFSCDGRFVSIGASMDEVLNKCGEPSDSESSYETKRQAGTWRSNYTGNVYPTNIYSSVRIDRWLYNFGRNRFMQLLIFENGSLVAIRSAGYGN
jgi:hypothetical protein